MSVPATAANSRPDSTTPTLGEPSSAVSLHDCAVGYRRVCLSAGQSLFQSKQRRRCDGGHYSGKARGNLAALLTAGRIRHFRVSSATTDVVSPFSRLDTSQTVSRNRHTQSESRRVALAVLFGTYLGIRSGLGARHYDLWTCCVTAPKPIDVALTTP